MKKVVSVFLAVSLLMLFALSSAASEDVQSNESEDAPISTPDRTYYDAHLVAFDAGDPDYPAYNPRFAYVSTVAYYVTNYRGGSYQSHSNHYFSKSDVISWMNHCNIFFIHTHGSAGTMQISQSSPTLLYTTDLSNENLTNLLCAVLLSCKSAKYIPTTVHMTQTFVNRGATCAVGFNDDISMDAANSFAGYFAEYTMKYGHSVAYSIQQISYLSGMSTICNAAVVCGTSSTTLN